MLRLTMFPMQTQELMDYDPKLLELLDYWQHSPHLELAFDFDGHRHVVEYTLAPASFLHYVHSGEKFGCYVGDMMFINAELAQKYPHWIPYVVVKLYAERFVDQGLDETGQIKHYETLFATIRWAASTLPRHELDLFLQLAALHERSDYYQLDHQVRQYLERIGGRDRYLEEKRKYLERHHRNQWVFRGRTEEAMLRIFQEEYVGFRNRSEVAYQALTRVTVADLYQAAMFVRTMLQVEPGTPVIVSPPDTAIAYALTKDGNGLTDLVRFQEHGGIPKGEDVIVRVGGKQQTWLGLSRRLSFEVHRAELAVQQLMEAKRGELHGLTVSLGQANTATLERLQEVRRQAATKKLLVEAIQQLSTMGEEYAGQVQELQEASAGVAQILHNFHEVQVLLVEAI